VRPLYAVQFEVAPREPDKQVDVTEQVLRAVASWISEWYLIRKSKQIDFPIEGGYLRPLDSHDLEVSRELSKSGDVARFVVSWSYPDDNDGNLLWHSRCEISKFGALTEFSFQLLLQSIQFYIAPVEFSLKRPRIIANLLRSFICTHGDTRLSLEPRGLAAPGVPSFVQDRLLSASRRLPIVVVSRTPIFDKWLVDPVELADRLAGIAEVIVLDDKWAGYALSEEVGKIYSCYNGAVRLYWPDFDLQESPYSPIYIPEKVSALGGKLIEIVFRQLAAISAFRFVPGPVAVDASDLLQEQRKKEIESIRKSAQDRGDFAELFDMSAKENQELQKSIDQLKEENSDLSARLQLSQENMKAIWGAQEDDQGIASSGAASEKEFEPESIEEAVLGAQSKLSETLVFQESALTSARRSPFKQPKKVFQALLAMHEVCQAWRQSRKDKVPSGSFEQRFANKGFAFVARESITSKGKWSEEYETTYKGQKVSIEQHLALGKGGPDTCLRIHFFTDEQDGKFIVAHVGRHKTNTNA
jgi:hypothetical protein